MFLFAKEEWVSEDRSLEITCKQNLDLSCSKNVLWCKIRKLDPLLKKVVSDPVDIFVYTSATRLLICWLFSFFFSCFQTSFSNEVVLLCAINLSEETYETGSRLLCQLLKWLLDSPWFDFTEPNTSPLVDVLVCNYISDVVDGSNLSSLRFSTFFALSTLTSGFLYMIWLWLYWNLTFLGGPWILSMYAWRLAATWLWLWISSSWRKSVILRPSAC